ncbi:MAG: H-X9-DG-CTERM domain-containing protein [Planctomycetota bacterium]
MDTRRSSERLTLGRGVAALGACALLATIVPPSLEQLRTRLQPVTCANNLRACHQAWTVYGNHYGGVWMAPWDQYGDRDDDAYSIDQQWPFVMNLYVAGEIIPDGMDAYNPGHPTHPGWYTVDGQRVRAKALQCPTLATQPPTNPWWGEWTNYSYAIMGCTEGYDGNLVYSISAYPVPGLMTHPATTVLLHDIGGIPAEGGNTQVWTRYPDMFTTDPHDGKSNYLFCDGHVELLAVEALDETMWMSRWVPEHPEP